MYEKSMLKLSSLCAALQTSIIDARVFASRSSVRAVMMLNIALMPVMCILLLYQLQLHMQHTTPNKAPPCER
jgi:hypothetical protein